jgi:hypothetical protein
VSVTVPVTPGATVGPLNELTTPTVCGVVALLARKLASPPYCAVSVFAPPVVDVRLHVVAGSVITQLSVPSLTLMVPVVFRNPGR